MPPAKAAEYRARAEEMVKCANGASTDHERLEYMKLAKAWLTLAGGEEQGLTTDQPCDESEA
jgi:hypothetical protein